MSSTASPPNAPKRVGFISTRFAGTDGVTLEAAKWSQVFESWGARCFWMAGELDKPLAVSHREPLAFFNHPEILDLQGQLFGQLHRPHWVSDRVHEVKETLKTSIYDFLTRFEIDLLIPQNALAIPMHVPLGLAITEVIAETGIPTIAHHHDFVWERERFAVTSAADYLAVAFPPMLPGVQHVVINSMQQAELTRRYQQASTVIPNVLDFDAAPPAIDDFSSDFRAQIGVARDDILVLQPTRLVARKGIEHTIELLRRMNMPELKLVLSHPPGDEGLGYWTFLQAQIAEAGVACIPIWERIAAARSLDPQGRKIFTLSDAYLHADLVTYPSLYEGFGNAFLEAVYFGKPVVVNTYPVFVRDIEPLGFQTVSMSGCVTDAVVEESRAILAQPDLRRSWATTNFALGQKHFSYQVLRQRLSGCLVELGIQ